MGRDGWELVTAAPHTGGGGGLKRIGGAVESDEGCRSHTGSVD